MGDILCKEQLRVHDPLSHVLLQQHLMIELQTKKPGKHKQAVAGGMKSLKLLLVKVDHQTVGVPKHKRYI
jgi:hypothetical protein